MNQECLTRNVFLLVYQSRGGWCQEIKLLFESIKMEELFTNLTICDINKARLKCHHGRNWKDLVVNKPKLRLTENLKIL